MSARTTEDPVKVNLAIAVVFVILIVAAAVVAYFSCISLAAPSTAPAAPPGSTAVMPETRNGEQRALQSRSSPIPGRAADVYREQNNNL